MKTVIAFTCLWGLSCATPPPAPRFTPMEVHVLVDGEEWSSVTGSVAASAEAKNGEASPIIDMPIVIADMPRSVAEGIVGTSALGNAVYAAGRAPDLRSLAKANGDIDLLTQPRIALHSGALVSIIRSNKESYVKDYTIESGHARAITAWLEEGTWIDATTTTSADGGSVDIDFAIQRRVIGRPIFDTTVSVPGTDFPVTVQLPEVDSTDTKAHVTLGFRGGYAFTFDPMQSAPTEPRVVVAVMTVDRASSAQVGAR